MIKRKEEFSLKELINIFLPKLWIVVIVSLLLGVATTLYALLNGDDQYTSTTKIHVIKDSSQDFNASDVTFAEGFLQTYLQVITYRDFHAKVWSDFIENNEVVENNKYYVDLEGNRVQVSVSSIGASISASVVQDILSISVTTTNKYLSCSIAKSVANVIQNKTHEVLAYPKGVVNASVVQNAEPSSVPNSRRVLLHTVIGVGVGAVLSMVVIFMFDFMDVIIHDKKKLEDNFDIPVLGVIPRFVAEEGKGKK